MKALFHINEQEKWNMVIENTKNLFNYMKDNRLDGNIEIVANGNSVLNLKNNNKEDNIIKELAELNKLGLDIAVCNNAISKFNISKDELYTFTRVVPAGVAEIIIKQNAGYAYIKP